MSAGVSNSSGQENSFTRSNAHRKGITEVDSTTQFSNTGTTRTKVPKWAKQANKTLYGQNAEASGDARDFLSALISDPYAGGETNRFGSAINRLFDTQLARARSGDARSTGVAKQGFREGAALTGAQDAIIGQGAGAATSLLQLANPNQQLDFSRLIAPQIQTNEGTTATQGTTYTNENSSGAQRGQTTMSGSNSGYGITLCCFIFMEYYSGREMPWFVRRCRDEFASGPRVLGYNRMAKWLVPLMRKSKKVSSVVGWLMTEPLTRWGGWLYNEKGYEGGWKWFPFVWFWFTLWKLMGTEDAQQEFKF